MLAAPQAFGGNPPLARRLILAGAVAVALIWPNRQRIGAAGPVGILGLTALAIAAFQLVPLPVEWVSSISPQAVEVGRVAGEAEGSRPLSLATGRTALGAEHLAAGLLVCCVAAMPWGGRTADPVDPGRPRWPGTVRGGVRPGHRLHDRSQRVGFPTGYQVRRGRLTTAT